jgi:hypothetical protein
MCVAPQESRNKVDTHLHAARSNAMQNPRLLFLPETFRRVAKKVWNRCCAIAPAAAMFSA